MYYNYEDKDLTKENLIDSPEFLYDARSFLAERENKDFKSLENPEDVYDAFMEHFRYQNVNEVTAMMDLHHAHKATAKQKKQMAHLMDTYERMDSDLGLKAIQDYAGGVFKAPSTYAGIFSFGAGKAGAVVANQGIRLSLKNILKKQMGKDIRKQALKSAAGSAIVDLPFSASLVVGNELTRVETGLKEAEDFDFSNVALSTAISTVAAGGIGAVTGSQRVVAGNISELVLLNARKQESVLIEKAHKTSTKYHLKNAKIKTQAKILKEEYLKMPLKESVPELLKSGKRLQKSLGEGKPISVIEEKTLDNIAVASARILEKIKPITSKNKKTGKIKVETVTSRIARGIRDGKIEFKDMSKILDEHNVTFQQFYKLFVAEASGYGRFLGKLGQISKAEKKQIFANMHELDKVFIQLAADPLKSPPPKLKELKKLSKNPLMDSGSVNLARGEKIKEARASLEKVKETIEGDSFLAKWYGGGEGTAVEKLSGAVYNINKARIGLMTIQFATTARNVGNGYLRNYIYGLDELGTSVAEVAKGVGLTGASMLKVNDEQLKLAGKIAFNKSKNNFRNAYLSFLGKDLWLGTQAWETLAVSKLLRDPKLGNPNIAGNLFKELGDIGNTTDARGGLMWLARKANYLNMLSDNMFKRAIFTRELDKSMRIKSQSILASGKNAITGKKLTQDEINMLELSGKGLKNYLEKAFLSTSHKDKQMGAFKNLPQDMLADAMEEALRFTYQAGSFNVKKGWFNQYLANPFIQLTSGKNAVATYFGSQAIPFSRYIVNQFIHNVERIPILGMLDLGSGIQSKGAGRGTYEYTRRVGRQMSGLAALFAFYQLRINYGNENTGPYEYVNPMTGNIISAEANLGPYMGMAYMADLLARATAPKRKPLFAFPKLGIEGIKLPQLHDLNISTDTEPKGRDLAKAFLGGFGRGGVGLDLLDGLANIATGESDDARLTERVAEGSAKVAGNFINSFSVGAGVLRDLYGAYGGPEYLYVPDTARVNLFEYFLAEAARNIPQRVDADEAVPQLYREKPIMRINPYNRLLLGITEKEAKTFTQAELDRLGFDYVEVAPKRILGNLPLNTKSKEKLSKLIDTELAAIIRGEEYQKLPNDAEKKIYLKTQLNILRNRAKEETLYVGDELEPLKKQELFKTQYLNIPKLERKAVTLLYDEEYGGNFLFDVEKNPRLYENMMGFYTDVYKGKPIGDASRRKIN